MVTFRQQPKTYKEIFAGLRADIAKKEQQITLLIAEKEKLTRTDRNIVTRIVMRPIINQEVPKIDRLIARLQKEIDTILTQIENIKGRNQDAVE